MNYIQIEISGQQVGLKFAYPQVKEFAIALEQYPTECFDKQLQNITGFGLAKLIQSAHKNNCLLKECKPAVTLEQISDWVDKGIHDEDIQNQILDVVNVWQQSEFTVTWLEEVKKKTQEMEAKKQSEQPKKSSKRLKQPSTPTGSENVS